MRRIVRASIILIFLTVPFAAWAQQPKTVGVGVILGQPTGLSAKYWINQTSAIDVAAAWNFTPPGSIYFQADYLYHVYHLFQVKQGKLPVYFGIGADVAVQPSPTIGMRVPIGIEYLFPNAPLGLFVEVGPGLSLYPTTAFQPSGGIGIRYLF